MSWLGYMRECFIAPPFSGKPLSTALSCIWCFRWCTLQNLGDAALLSQAETACPDRSIYAIHVGFDHGAESDLKLVACTDLTCIGCLCTPRIGFGEQHPERGAGVEAQHHYQADASRNI